MEKIIWQVISGTRKSPQGWIGSYATYPEAKEKAGEESPAYIQRGPDWGK